MTGVDFLALAVRLSAGASEAERRSAVSRAYYGAFHLARELVESFGVEFPSTAESHQKLLYCLDACIEAAPRMAGMHLRELRIDRNTADYDLSDSTPFNRASVAKHIKAALHVESLIAQCALDPLHGAIRTQVRTYAADVLRLTVR